MSSVCRRKASPRAIVQIEVNIGRDGSMCIEIATEHEAEEVPSNNWRQAKEAPVLREVDFLKRRVSARSYAGTY